MRLILLSEQFENTEFKLLNRLGFILVKMSFIILKKKHAYKEIMKYSLN